MPEFPSVFAALWLDFMNSRLALERRQIDVIGRLVVPYRPYVAGHASGVAALLESCTCRSTTPFFIGFFSLAMLVTYLAFVPPETANRCILTMRARPLVRRVRRLDPKAVRAWQSEVFAV